MTDPIKTNLHAGDNQSGDRATDKATSQAPDNAATQKADQSAAKAAVSKSSRKKSAQAPQTTRKSAGAILADTRLAKGLTVNEVADQLKLTRKTIEALETNNTKELPPTIFTRGYLRAYCKYLGLDENQVLEPYESESAMVMSPAAPTAASTPIVTQSGSRKGGRWLLLLLLIVAIAGAVYWWVSQSSGDWSIENTFSGLSGDETDAANGLAEGTDINIQLSDVTAGNTEGSAELGAIETGASSDPASNSPRDPASNPSNNLRNGGSNNSSAGNGAAGASNTQPPGVSDNDSSVASNNQTDVSVNAADNAADQAGQDNQDNQGSSQNSNDVPSESDTAAENTAEASQNAAGNNDADAAVVAQDPYDFVLKIGESSSWVSIRDRNSRVVVREELPAGFVKGYNGNGPYRVFLGRGDMVTVEIDGQAVDFQDKIHPRRKTARFNIEAE